MNFSRNLLTALAILIASYSSVSLFGIPAQNTSQNLKQVSLIPVLEKNKLLNLISEGKHVIFVDAREQEEFDEEHIPGAKKILLRDINQNTLKDIGTADVVVAYCLKDFRGYEVAKALHNIGVQNVYTMENPGLNGWKSNNLPTITQRNMTVTQEIEALVNFAISHTESSKEAPTS